MSLIMKNIKSEKAVYKIVKAYAFTAIDKIENKKVIGNPASIVICNKRFPPQTQMQQMAVKEKQPMTAFVLHEKENNFSIKYFTPLGIEFGLCVHATLIASSVVQQEFGYTNIHFNAHKISLSLTLSNSFLSTNHTVAQIKLPTYMPVLVNHKLPLHFLKIVGVEQQDIKYVYKCDELKDEIIVLNNAEILRSVKPNFLELSKVLTTSNTRGLFLTSLSTIKNIDYEVRIFAPHFGIDEDISCGSANCSLIPLWHKIFNEVGNKEYRIICPYNGKDNVIGGVELGVFDVENNSAFIGGIVTS